MNRRNFIRVAGWGAGVPVFGVRQGVGAVIAGGEPVAARETDGRQFPRVQVIPLPDDKASFQHDGQEVLRYNFGDTAPKTYCWPLVGPARRAMIRIGHPHDPVSHRHHRGIWVAHANVNGTDFWGENSGSAIRHEAIELYEDGPTRAGLVARNGWLTSRGEKVLTERRTLSMTPLAGGECAMDIQLEFHATDGAVTFEALPFGFLGVRVAKTMSVADGGGTIINSEGGSDEKGTFWKRAKWVNYAGPIAPQRRNGILVLDHPSNLRHPTYWHTRRDGWMGASFTLKEPFRLAEGDKLKLNYRLVVHDGDADPERAEGAWKQFAAG